jgi:hypothetical protein
VCVARTVRGATSEPSSADSVCGCGFGVAMRLNAGMKTRLTCPCGESFTAADEDSLVTQVQAHLAEAHPGLEYDREQILFIAT